MHSTCDLYTDTQFLLLTGIFHIRTCRPVYRFSFPIRSKYVVLVQLKTFHILLNATPLIHPLSSAVYTVLFHFLILSIAIRRPQGGGGLRQTILGGAYSTAGASAVSLSRRVRVHL